MNEELITFDPNDQQAAELVAMRLKHEASLRKIEKLREELKKAEAIKPIAVAFLSFVPVLRTIVEAHAKCHTCSRLIPDINRGLAPLMPVLEKFLEEHDNG